jgi:hypothetical protein
MSNKVVQSEEDFQIIDEEKVDLDNLAPQPTDSGWTQYVLNQLEPDEIFDGNPKSDGLRRLVEKLRGPIIDQISEMKHWPTHGENQHDQNSATVVSIVTILDMRTGKPMRTSGTADASGISCPPPYDKYLSSIAETRAEARAYRKILRLKNVVSADEMGRGDKVPSVDLVNSAQIDMIDKFCKDLNLDVKKVCIKVSEQDKPNIKQITLEGGSKIMEKLNECRKSVSAGKKLPPELSGYDGDWKVYFG